MHLSLILVLCLVGAAHGCIYQYGARHEVPHFSYGYIGLDWPHHYDTCTGSHQSPIHIPAHSTFERVKSGEESVFGFGKLTSTGSNIKVVNNGHTVQVALPADYKPDATVVAKGDPNTATLISKFSNSSAASTATRVKISPAQFHFHTHSEHVIDGKEYPLEMHIVNWVKNDTLPGCGSGGCATVVGIMFELHEEDTATGNHFIDTIFNTMPSFKGMSSFLPTGVELNFDEVLPADRSYVTYYGSLTTPPCTEGILWHLLLEPVKITRQQLHKFELAVGDNYCAAGVAEKAASEQSAAAGDGAAQQLKESGTAAPTTSTHTTSTTTTAAAGHTSTAEEFEVPAFTTDPVDSQSCRKLANGQNYREVQDRQERPILFHAAPGVCDDQLVMLAGRSKVLGKLLYPNEDESTMTLAQYREIVAADLTQEADCAGIATSGAVGSRSAMLLVHLLLGLLVVLGLIAA